MKVETTSGRLEQIFDREFSIGTRRLAVVGTSSVFSVAWLLASSTSKTINGLPHVVVVSSLADANRFEHYLSSIDPLKTVSILPSFDVTPYSGLYANPNIISERLYFLNQATHAKPGDIFVVTAESIVQNTLPFKTFTAHRQVLKKDDDLPTQWTHWLEELGYIAAPAVEERGHFAARGGILDIWSPAEKHPVRIELFGDTVESLRYFRAEDQTSFQEIASFTVAPAREVLFLDDNHEAFLKAFRKDLSTREVSADDSEDLLRSLVLKQHSPGVEFLLPFVYSKLDSPLDYFSSPLNFWVVDPDEVMRANDDFLQGMKEEAPTSNHLPVHPPLEKLYGNWEELDLVGTDNRRIDFSTLDSFTSEDSSAPKKVRYPTAPLADFVGMISSMPFGSEEWQKAVHSRLQKWRSEGNRVFISGRPGPSAERLKDALTRSGLAVHAQNTGEYLWDTWLQEQERAESLVHFLGNIGTETIFLEEDRIIFLREDDFWGRKERRPTKKATATEEFQKKAKRLAFGDLKPGDLVVHEKHGIGQYEGLTTMNIGGAESEFIQLSYKDKDKLYLPVYRIGQLQKYSSGTVTAPLDKLGGTGWEKTKSKVRAHLRDIASELLALYAKRAESHRPAFALQENDLVQFEKGFPYEETDDQLRAIEDIKKDMASTKPMDRLICGDVGFGKTEVAMRAAFFAVQSRKQVVVLAPTTVLTFQHFETFKKRFAGWPVEIRVLNRFVPDAEARKTIADTKEGKVDILIGTHRLFSQKIGYKDLGLLIVDEEQKFGVAHKEKIRKLRVSVDTLTLSATPIPRTLNMSFVGVRDLSIINTAPVDRLPTRTFISKWDDETIRKSIESEIARGGQIYFIHNRVQSLPSIVDELRTIVPKARLRMAHGQMEEHELESAMLAFFNHEIDVLVCTAIVESGMDVSRANTMFIDRADLFGLSQLYQLRGRVGRSKLRAYCYLILPRKHKLDKEAQERLRVIQENTALGSGIRIAQYDLELRGSGSILGEEQSGHVDAVGYEMYMELLQQALAEAQGEPYDTGAVDPEINLRVPALIPDSYINDVRIRLSYYKALSEISSEEELNQIGEELKDQFGDLPEPVLTLMGLMLIRKLCKDLGIRDVSAGTKTVSLVFTEHTKLKPEYVIKLAMRENKKYAITPDNRLNIRMNTITWTSVYEELQILLQQVR